MKFLRQLAHRFYADESDNISNLCFVFPNRRAGLFFRKYLGEVAERPLFSPRIITIQELFSEISGLLTADKLELIYTLFGVYRKHSPSAESFDDFYYWGEVLLNDFDDIDKYMVDARRLFTNVKDLREIDDMFSYLTENQLNAIRSFWSGFLGESGNTGDHKEQFKTVWEVLLPVYNEFTAVLRENGKGYEGLIHRDAIEKLESGNLTEGWIHRQKGFVFAGFNAISECERELFRYFKRERKGDFYWDYCGPFIKERSNRASAFMWQNKEEFPSLKNIDFEPEGLPEIIVTGVPSGSAQAAVAGEIMEECCSNGADPLQNAVVLPDESLLIPVLYSLPQEEKTVNVTMGMPLRGTAVASLMESLTDFQSGDFYYKRVLNVLKNGFVRSVEPEASALAEREIAEENLIYVPQERLMKNDFFKLIFRQVGKSDGDPSGTVKRICTYLEEVILYLISAGLMSKSEKEYIYHYHTAVRRLMNIGIPMKAVTFSKILRQITAGITIPFEGEPLSGMQIMGILETRCLDFENIVFCSMNEGVYPVRNTPNSFIPYNLRRGFGLPSFEHRDSVLAYNFYRSICRAKKVWLIYDTRTEGLVTGEPSRYIYQLKYHYASEIPGLRIRESIRTYTVPVTDDNPIVIKKSPDIMKIIEEKYFSAGGKSLSATSLNSYIDCSLSFYFRYILDLEEESEVEESMEASTFGTIFHDSVHDIYQRFKGMEISPEELVKLLKSNEPEDVADKVFGQILKSREIKGYNKIIRELIVKYLRETIKYDSSIAPFVYVSGEEKFEAVFTTPAGKEFRAYARIDRIDRTGKAGDSGDMYRIVDYKTGKGDRFDEDVEYYFRRERTGKSNIMFQMLFYALMFSKVSKEASIAVSPYILRDIVRGERTERAASAEELHEFEDRLSLLAGEIADSSVPFTQAVQSSAKDPCAYCPFLIICKRSPYGKSV
jgi:RecB family exonuclease